MKHMKLTAEFYFGVTDEMATFLHDASEDGRPILQKVGDVAIGVAGGKETQWSYFMVRSFEEAK